MFAQYIKDISASVSEMDFFDSHRFTLQLAAIKRALSTRRLRWLYGMEYHLSQGENVYGETTDPDLIQEIVNESISSEYHKALIIEMLKAGPLSVRELAEESRVPVYTISLRLNELEREGKAAFHSHEGTTAKFIGLAA